MSFTVMKNLIKKPNDCNFVKLKPIYLDKFKRIFRTDKVKQCKSEKFR